MQSKARGKPGEGGSGDGGFSQADPEQGRTNAECRMLNVEC
jgi:hypothetical protein